MKSILKSVLVLAMALVATVMKADGFVLQAGNYTFHSDHSNGYYDYIGVVSDDAGMVSVTVTHHTPTGWERTSAPYFCNHTQTCTAGGLTIQVNTPQAFSSFIDGQLFAEFYPL